MWPGVQSPDQSAVEAETQTLRRISLMMRTNNDNDSTVTFFQKFSPHPTQQLELSSQCLNDAPLIFSDPSSIQESCLLFCSKIWKCISMKKGSLVSHLDSEVVPSWSSFSLLCS